MDGAKGGGVGAVQHLAAMPASMNQACGFEHAEVLGHRGLSQLESYDDVTYRLFLAGEQHEDVAAAGFGDSVEDVGVSRGAGHDFRIYSVMGICQ